MILTIESANSFLGDLDPNVPTVSQSRHKTGSYLARMKDWFGV
jgi:predicted aconitase with swiveling domain